MELNIEQNFITLLFLLTAVHFLCDSALQGDFLAKNKVRYNFDGQYNPIWWWALTAHSFIHALGVYIVTNSLIMAVFMLISHWVVDLLKGEGHLDFNQDQLCHMSFIVFIAIIQSI